MTPERDTHTAPGIPRCRLQGAAHRRAWGRLPRLPLQGTPRAAGRPGCVVRLCCGGREGSKPRRSWWRRGWALRPRCEPGSATMMNAASCCPVSKGRESIRAPSRLCPGRGDRSQLRPCDRGDQGCPSFRPLSGGGGIRTHEGPSTPNGFQDRLLKPLGHPSGVAENTSRVQKIPGGAASVKRISGCSSALCRRSSHRWQRWASYPCSPAPGRFYPCAG